MATIVLRSIRFSYTKSRHLKAAFYTTQPERVNRIKVGKVVNVAIIGAPNSGKSTLINNITERWICAASNKVHTTTKMIRALCYHNGTQIIFLDTPGVITDKEQKKYKLPESMIGACHKSLRCADVVGVVHDVSNRHTKHDLHPDVTAMLQMVENTPSFLILNKVDTLKYKKQLLSAIRNLCNGVIAGNPIPGSEGKKFSGKGYGKFSDVFIVSALKGDGMQDIKEYLVANAKPANYQYSPDEWTDQEPAQLVLDAVRAKFLDFLNNEIPYNLKTQIEYFEEIPEEDKIMTSVIVECPSERLVKLIAGAGGGRLQQIKSHVRSDLMELFKRAVVIDIQLKAKDNSESIVV